MAANSYYRKENEQKDVCFVKWPNSLTLFASQKWKLLRNKGLCEKNFSICFSEEIKMGKKQELTLIPSHVFASHLQQISDLLDSYING